MKYKNRHFALLFQGMLDLASDPSSNLYYNGKPHRGASHRCAFWDGYSGQYTLDGPRRSANVVPDTLSSVCFNAGRAFARRYTLLDNDGVHLFKRAV